MHGRSKLGKSTFRLTALRVAPCAVIKSTPENTAFKVQEKKTLVIQKFENIVRGSIPPDPTNVHVLFLRKMTMFLTPITYRETN